MKIIRDNYNRTTNNDFPARVICEHCNSDLLIDESDVTIGVQGIYHYICPCCQEDNTIDEMEGLIITKDNLEFPTHFFHFDYEKTYPTPEDIKKTIKELIGRTDTREHLVYTAGRSLYVVERNDEEDGFMVSVAPNYYSVNIEFTDEDYR